MHWDFALLFKIYICECIIIEIHKNIWISKIGYIFLHRSHAYVIIFRMCFFIERRLLDALFLTLRNFATSFIGQRQGSGACSWVCVHSCVRITYRRGLCIARFDRWAMRRPRSVEQVTCTDTHVFCFILFALG